MPDIASPCVGNCCLNDDDICLGCCRSIDEILLWGRATNQQKNDILGQINQRKIDQQCPQNEREQR